MNLTISKQQPYEGCSVIEVEGEIDIYSSNQLKTTILEEIESGAKRVAVVLSNVDYMDSTGLGLLIGAYKSLREKRGSLVVVSPSPRIVRIFEVTGMNKIFDIFPSVDDAFASEESV